MVYNPLGKNLLFPSWLIGNGKEKLIEEVVLILPTRGRGRGVIDSMGKVFFTTLGKVALCLGPTGEFLYVDDLNSLGNLCWFYPYLPRQRS